MAWTFWPHGQHGHIIARTPFHVRVLHGHSAYVTSEAQANFSNEVDNRNLINRIQIASQSLYTASR
eukprot:scaffold130991_cov49-Prasinocladus_malaysianus.AAC.2